MSSDYYYRGEHEYDIWKEPVFMISWQTPSERYELEKGLVIVSTSLERLIKYGSILQQIVLFRYTTIRSNNVVESQHSRQIKCKTVVGKIMDFGKIDEVIDNNPKLAYEQLKKSYDSNEENKTNIDLLWRLGKACLLWANTLQKKDPKKKLLILEGRTYATSAYTYDENNAEVLRWAAILIGSATDFLGPKEKIEQGKIFKAYLDRAIKMKSTEYSLLHSRGRFAYEVVNLSWIEKRLCSILFSEVPHSTIDEALNDFLEAEKYSPFIWPENLLYIARCYAVMKNKKLAKKYLEKVEMIERLDEAEAEALIEVRAAVSKLK